MTPPLAIVPRPPLLDRLPDGGHVVLEASAGTGKTFALENLVVDLLLREGADIDQILVLTFTERAAAELKARVRKMIERLLDARDFVPAAGTSAWVLGAAEKVRLADALRGFERATLGTIHSFCQRILLENAFANRRLFQQRQADGRELFGRAFKETLRTRLATEPGHVVLLSRALERWRDPDGLEDRLYECHVLRGELRPALDPARLAAALRDFPAMLGEEAIAAGLRGAVQGAQPRKVAEILARRLAPVVAAAREGAHPLEEILVAIDRLPAVSKRHVLDYLRDALGPPEAAAGPVARAAAELAAAAVPFVAAIAHRFLPPVRERLASLKQVEGLFDFDDMLQLVRDGLRGPGGGQLVASLRARFRFALIDEFQDTDEVQWDIFRSIFFEPLAAGTEAARTTAPGAARLFLVGDPKQAIYSFRGADIHAYLEARREVLAAGGAVLPLRENYRSTAAIVAAYNAILDQEAPAPFFPRRDDGIAYDEPVRCGCESLAFEAPETPASNGGRAAIHLFALRSGGEPWSAAKARSLLHRAIAREIRRLLFDGRPPRFGDPQAGPLREIGAGDIYVLTRTRSESVLVGQALREAGVPHAFYKQEGLFQTEEAAHVLALLTAVATPGVAARRYRAWLTPFFGLSLAELPAVRDLPAADPLVATLLDWHALGAERRFDVLFERILEDSGILRRLAFQGDADRALTNYHHLFELLAEEIAGAGGTLDELVALLRALVEERRRPASESGNVQRLETDRNAVQIMTMHNAKGLEAAIVFVAGGLGELTGTPYAHVLHDEERRIVLLGKPPAAAKARIREESDDEERRLLYVALTRAKGRLYLPFAPPDAAGKERIEGPYRHLNGRLRALLGDEAERAGGRLFSVEDARPPAEANRSVSPDHGTRAQEASGAAAPAIPREMFEEIGEREAEQFAQLRRAHAGPVVTSYTRMKGHARPGAIEREELAGEASAREPQSPPAQPDGPAAGAPPAAFDAGELPPGVTTGILLHELLEGVDLAPLAAGLSLADWTRRPEVRRLFAVELRKHGAGDGAASKAMEIVHTAFTAPVALGEGGLLPGLASAARSVREMEFLYPFPEESHPRLLGRPPPEGFAVQRGYVKGFVDYLFEHDGRAYFVDWKSDALPDFAPATLARTVAERYELQAQLYSLALVKLYGIASPEEYERRFGGLLYCFLRGMRPKGKDNGMGDEGIYFARPSFAEALDWERALLARSP